jgi:hypothetical protein
LLEHLCRIAMAGSFVPKMAIPSSLSCGSQGEIMFKRGATGQRILPSEPGAPSMTRAPAPMTNSGSISADLGYLHHVGDEEREDYVNGEQPPPIQYPGLQGLSAVGYMFRRLRLRR